MGCLVLFGISGYMLIEGYTFLEAIYMTIITIGGVGFSEVKSLSDAGRVFTIILIVINLGLFTYFITLLTRYFMDGEFVKRFKKIKMENHIKQLQNHVIVCGFGRNGKESALVLHKNNIPFVIIDDKEMVEDFDEFEVKYFIKGDATQDETLVEAGVENASAIITSLPIDANNLFVVLTARQLNKNITIISRASQDSSVNKLKIAGASNVIMPEKVGGAQMATLVMLPDVVEFVSQLTTKNNADFKLAELEVNGQIVLKDLNLWQQCGCTIMGIKSNKEYIFNPQPEYIINTGQRIIVMGSQVQIEKAKKLL
jgi:voltage-gated potassium channel